MLKSLGKMTTELILVNFPRELVQKFTKISSTNILPSKFSIILALLCMGTGTTSASVFLYCIYIYTYMHIYKYIYMHIYIYIYIFKYRTCMILDLLLNLTVELILVNLIQFWWILGSSARDKECKRVVISCLLIILNILLKMTVELILVNFGQ